MKKILLIIISIVLVLTSSFGLLGCDFTSGDVNDVVDNYFEKYSEMGKTETGAYSKFKDINVEASYLGYGYDVINDPYMDVKKIAVSYPILDMNKIENINLMMQKVNSGSVDESFGSTMEEFYNDYSASVNVYGNVGKFFSGGLKTDFSGSNSEKNYWYFYKLSYYFDSFYIHITNTVDDLRNYLSETFAYDLINLPIEQVFDRYGTHLIKEAAMGGRVEKSVTYSSESNTDKTAMNAAVNMHISAFGSSINAEASTSANEKLSKEQIEYKQKITQLGGKAISLVGEVNYDKWASSFDESLEYATLSGIVSENSLVGIWELLPEGYEERADQMASKFVELSNGRYNELCEMFKLADLNPNIPNQPTNDTINYAGGGGTVDNPYLISNIHHLINIQKNMDAHFKLTNDIDLSSMDNWEPIGGYYMESAFNGTLDGNGYKIKSLKRSSVVPEKDLRAYFGLFSCIGSSGTVKNIVFDNVDVQVKGAPVDNRNSCVFLGVVAGKCLGTVSNVTLNGVYDYSNLVGGQNWIGGICGYAVGATISHCKNNMTIKSLRWACAVGGIVAYSESGSIEYCTNTGTLSTVGSDWSGFALTGCIGAETHKTNPTRLVGNTNSGTPSAKAYDGSAWFENCTIATGTTDFARRYDKEF